MSNRRKQNCLHFLLPLRHLFLSNVSNIFDDNEGLAVIFDGAFEYLGMSIRLVWQDKDLVFLISYAFHHLKEVHFLTLPLDT
mmetsp:Transcript_36679/g.35462  ORF Transcript_36679/g.35462 Transcript_36679/m.35462 type:complete len:82 (+) Transcript_36679:1450-1695(+)